MSLKIPKINHLVVVWLFSFHWIISIADGLQFPFEIELPFGKEKSDKLHYSKLSEDDLPINLQQYSKEIVVRFNYDGNHELKKYLLQNDPNEIIFKKWGKNVNKQTIDIQTSEDSLLKLIEKFSNQSNSMNYEIIIDDLPQSIYETYPTNEFHISETDDFKVQSEIFFKEYRPLDSINAWLELLKQTYPELVSIENIGNTYEHRDFNVVHLSMPSDGIDHEDKKTVVITAGVHAREWISVSSSLYLLYEMIQYYENNPHDRKILANLDFLFIPVLNPDGYVYTWEHDRLWRKNRQRNSLGTESNCVGIDIDHSYDYHWTHSSDTICEEEYSGEFPFEAYESKVWKDYLNSTNNNHKIWGYLDLHSYSQEILMPYAYSCGQLPRDEENLIELAYGIAKAIRLQLGKSYNVLPACLDRDSDLIPDLGSGSALDYMYHNRAYWAYQLKLRDSGSHGFLLPNKYIEPVGQEIYAGVRYFCSFILNDE